MPKSPPSKSPTIVPNPKPVGPQSLYLNPLPTADEGEASKLVIQFAYWGALFLWTITHYEFDGDDGLIEHVTTNDNGVVTVHPPHRP